MDLIYNTTYKGARAESRNKAFIAKYGEDVSRSFSTWSPMEDLELKAEVNIDKLNLTAIALLHKRSNRAIEARLKILNLKVPR